MASDYQIELKPVERERGGERPAVSEDSLLERVTAAARATPAFGKYAYRFPNWDVVRGQTENEPPESVRSGSVYLAEILSFATLI